MISRDRIEGRPILEILSVLPLALSVSSLAADLVALTERNAAPWRAVAFWALAAGLVAALAAAVPGLVGLRSLRRGRATILGKCLVKLVKERGWA